MQDEEVLDQNQDIQDIQDTSTLEQEIDRLKNSNSRLLAEMVNIKKNAESDSEKKKLGLILKIISILDTYSLITQNQSNNEIRENDLVQENNSDSLNHILQELEVLLATENVRKVDLKIGDDFNPKYSEVISTVAGDEDGKVAIIISPSYEMKGNVIKTAKIIVSKKK